MRFLDGVAILDGRTAQHEHVSVVVLHALVCRVRVMAQAGADTADFIGRHRCTHAATANHDASLGFLAENHFANGLGEIRIIYRGVLCVPGSTTSWPDSSSRA
ncbi:MAG: hypothetical protein QG663_1586 [Thermodesulfobacteriota bacterium]|nr:hypothetical protein [Planctomycetota bacterium]MDQ1286156.1 hypothetical protein [Thermodesulfobacteriota bacterium]